MSINELFTTESNATNNNARMLNGTAELTRISNNIATRIIRGMEEQIDVYRERIAKSATDTKEMDAILDEFKPWADIEEDHILRHLDDATVEGMLKSQQSKRSRTKGKQMTLDNYKTLMTATIAEQLLREIYNKPKQISFSARRAGTVDYTPADLERYADDQEALRKEIRNIQSKKSIMKSKADFDENSEQWIALLKAEQMLKDLRAGGERVVVEVDHTKDRLKELLSNVDADHLKATDSKDLLKAIKEMIDNEG